MKRKIIVTIGALIVLAASTAVATNSVPTQPNSNRAKTTVQTVVDPVEETAPAQTEAEATAPAPSAESTPAPSQAPSQTESAQAPVAPEPEPVTLIQCTGRIVDTGVEGSKTRYEHYKDCRYSDGSTTSEFVGSTSTPNTFIET